MGIGGQLNARGRLPVHLERAYTGVTRYQDDGWVRLQQPLWVIDCINHGRQRQRIGTGRPFQRLSGVIAIYAPNRQYSERREAGYSLDESYILFTAGGAVARALRGLTGAANWCHIRDPDHLATDHLRQMGELLFHRRPGFELMAQGSLLELLGLLTTAVPVGPRLRVLRRAVPETERRDLPGRVENYIRRHITTPIRVAELARHVSLSATALAHAYSPLAGETPLHTIQRLKIEAAKRLLLQEGLSVKEAAARLGFSSEFHFSRLFKRLEGVAPQHYCQALTKTARRQGRTEPVNP